jgi:hypothetical protein
MLANRGPSQRSKSPSRDFGVLAAGVQAALQLPATAPTGFEGDHNAAALTDYDTGYTLEETAAPVHIS